MEAASILPCHITVPDASRQSDLFHSHTAESHQAAKEIVYHYYMTHLGPRFELSRKMADLSRVQQSLLIEPYPANSVSGDQQHFGCLQRAKLLPLTQFLCRYLCRLPLFSTRSNLASYRSDVTFICTVVFLPDSAIPCGTARHQTSPSNTRSHTAAPDHRAMP